MLANSEMVLFDGKLWKIMAAQCPFPSSVTFLRLHHQSTSKSIINTIQIKQSGIFVEESQQTQNFFLRLYQQMHFFLILKFIYLQKVEK